MGSVQGTPQPLNETPGLQGPGSKCLAANKSLLASWQCCKYHRHPIFSFGSCPGSPSCHHLLIVLHRHTLDAFVAVVVATLLFWRLQNHLEGLRGHPW